MLVSTMTFDASGQIKNRCAFAEGRSNVNSGELVIAPAAASAETEKAKVASEETEEVEAVEANPAKAKADDEAAGEEKKDDKKKDDAADI